MASSTADRARVEALLPHRAPFLFVDRIAGRGPEWIATEWHVSEDLDVFRGHYPENPVLPGVLIAEHCFQSAALAVLADADGDDSSTAVPVLSKIADARFKRMVRPGQTLTTRVQLEDRLANARYCSAKVTCDDATVARLRFVLAMAPAQPAEEER